MGHLSYLAVLLAIALGSLWLEVVMRTRVLRRWRRLALTVVPVVVVFVLWDAFAVRSRHWSFDPGSVVGVEPVAALPIEEMLFFVIVPLASILTFEAVRAVWCWPAGDEPPSARMHR